MSVQGEEKTKLSTWKQNTKKHMYKIKEVKTKQQGKEIEERNSYLLENEETKKKD